MAKRKRVDGKTPSGGDYSELVFLNAAHDVVDETEATEFIIRECKEGGELINTVYGIVKKDNAARSGDT